MTTSIQSLNSTQSAILVNGVQSVVLDSTGIVSGIGKNKLINSLGIINQRGVSGTVTLAAGAYGHDRFKAGASGCTYTFSTALNFTIFTISAGTLVQIIEGLNLQSGPVVLGWTGTSQGRIDAGAYGASGITGTAIGGNNMAVEFGGGTVSLAQLETGSKSSYFEQRHVGLELSLCQRYYEISYPTIGLGACSINVSFNPQYVTGRIFQVTKRAYPTIVLSGRNGTPGKLSSVATGGDIGTGGTAVGSASITGFASCYDPSSPFTTGAFYEVGFTASAEL